MNISALILAAASLLVSSSKAEAQHCSKPCHCDHHEAVEIVRCLQREFNRNTQFCNFEANRHLTLPEASYRVIDPFCTNPGGCCYDSGPMDQWWLSYSCADSLYYPEATWEVKVLCNGTVAVNNVVEIGTSVVMNVGTPTNSAYSFNYLWFPVSGAKCKFRLGYVSGNAVQCPATLTSGLPCSSCQNPPTP
jgi:hypothetical protein